jgi:hypothetical protein
MLGLPDNKKGCSIEALITKDPHKSNDKRLYITVSIARRPKYVLYTPKLSALVDADTKAARKEVSADEKEHSMVES